MTNRTQAVLDAALALPEDERSLLVEQLLEALPSDEEELSEEELFAELERRRVQVDQGVVKPIPWSEFQIED